MPKVTVYIVSHNYGHYLSDAIESVLRQNYDDWELLIINDNSTDNTAAVMELYRGDDRIRLFHTKGIGLTAVCNLAVAEARGELVIRLDGDDIFDENILLVLANHLARNPETALVFPDYFLTDEFGTIISHERRERLAHANHLLDVPANGACTLVRKSVILEIGGYREDLKAQDGFDLWSKITAKYRCANVNLPLFFYRRHGTNLTNNAHRILNARREIKKDAILHEMRNFKPFIAVIPCRKNYDFVPDLWNQALKGRSLLRRAIETCLKSQILDHVFVACDNEIAREEIEHFQDPRLKFFLRRTDDTLRSRSIVPTLESIAKQVDPTLNGLTVLCYTQAPFVTTATLEESIFTMLMNQTDSSIGVQEIKDHLLRRTSFGLQSINPKGEIRTDFDVVYSEANIALATKNKNFRVGSLTGPAIGNFIVSHDECFFIDSARNLKIANVMNEDS